MEPPTQEEFEAYHKKMKVLTEGQKEILICIQEHINEELTEEFIHELHRIVFKREANEEKGAYKKEKNVVYNVYKDYDETANPEDVARLMKEWIERQNKFIETEIPKEEIIKHICHSALEFADVHPYKNGNGRIGRALMLYLGIRKSLYPIVIPKEQRFEYGRYMANKDVNGLSKMLMSNLDKEATIYSELISQQEVI